MVDYFQKTIQEKDVPWHTSLIHQHNTSIQRTHMGEPIPHIILVHPNGDTAISIVEKPTIGPVCIPIFKLNLPN